MPQDTICERTTEQRLKRIKSVFVATSFTRLASLAIAVLLIAGAAGWPPSACAHGTYVEELERHLQQVKEEKAPRHAAATFQQSRAGQGRDAHEQCHEHSPSGGTCAPRLNYPVELRLPTTPAGWCG
jgi:hypothetical protein